VCAGAGGHAGALSPFALVQEVRRFYDGPVILSGSITTLTSLDFLGFGLPTGSPSLGELLSQGKTNIQSPWLGITGFLVLAIMLSLLIFIGEAVRDAFDPRKAWK
jgi:microcin C transport system permease protein